MIKIIMLVMKMVIVIVLNGSVKGVDVDDG